MGLPLTAHGCGLTERTGVEPPTHIGQGRPHRGVEHGTRTVQGIRCGHLTAHPPLGSRRAVLLQRVRIHTQGRRHPHKHDPNGRPTAQRPGREDEQHHKERMALRHAGQEPRRGQAAHRKSRADVQHPTSTSGPRHENATTRTPKAHLTCDIAPLALGGSEPPAAGHPLGVFHGLVFIHAKRPAQTWTDNKQCLTLQTDGCCKPNLDFGEGHDNLNTT